MLAPVRSASVSRARSHSARSMAEPLSEASDRSASQNSVSENLQRANSQPRSDTPEKSAKLKLQFSNRALVSVTFLEIALSNVVPLKRAPRKLHSRAAAPYRSQRSKVRSAPLHAVISTLRMS